MTVSEDDKSIAKYLRDIFGVTSTVIRYGNDDKPDQTTFVLQSKNPKTHLVEYSSIGLSNSFIDYYKTKSKLPVGIEIGAVANEKWELFPHIITTAVFNTINNNMQLVPGEVMKGVVNMYYPDVETKHLLFSEPFYWEGRLDIQRFKTKQVVWLMALPITENEYNFMNLHGEEALLDLFEKEDVRFYDLDRKSLI